MCPPCGVSDSSGEPGKPSDHADRPGATVRSTTTPKSTTRRLAAAVAMSGLAFGLVGTGTPAYAGPAATSGICNGVVNQLAHRGTVQENLLKAAAKKNADQIARLQAERATLQSSASALTEQIAQARQRIAALD